MPDINDYLDWRGDIPATKDNINEVDNLIFCLLSYVDFEGILPADPHADGMTLREAAKEYFFTHKEDEPHPLGLIVPAEIITLFRRLSETARYQNLWLTGYVNEVSKEREMQFSALTITLPDRGFFTAFRGTDDTIVGWKEDLMLSYLDEVPAQRKATSYLDSLSLQDGDTLYVGGHSKGGNLAVWGAVHASEKTQNAIKRVYSNDGPGFTEAMITSQAYQRMADRLTFLLPQSSLIGLLLANDSTYQIVKSRTLGVFQHNGLSWDVMGPSFVRQEKLSGRGMRTDTVVRERIDGMSKDEKRAFVEMLFEILESTGATTLTELADGKMKTAMSMLKTYQAFDKEKKEMATYLFGKLFDLKLPQSKSKSKADESTASALPPAQEPHPLAEAKENGDREELSETDEVIHARASKSEIKVVWHIREKR
ncbi:MAG: DUF2974 domain-containing protein [Clostridia bacterium]|nr:DUF2974 domain-containing protein [Clostridia bacterium]